MTQEHKWHYWKSGQYGIRYCFEYTGWFPDTMGYPRFVNLYIERVGFLYEINVGVVEFLLRIEGFFELYAKEKAIPETLNKMNQEFAMILNEYDRKGLIPLLFRDQQVYPITLYRA